MILIINYLLLLLVLFFGCFYPIYFIFHDRNIPLTIAHFFFYINIGLSMLGIFGIICLINNISLKFSILPSTLIALYAINKNNIPSIQKILFPTSISVSAFFAIVAILTSFLYLFIAGLWMGTGTYPGFFFNVDSPYYLGQILGIISNPTWPPLSLSNLSCTANSGYHYGSQSICAVLSVITGISPHTTSFLVYVPLVQLGIISAIWLIVGKHRTVKNNTCAWLCIAFLLYVSYFPLFEMLKAFIKHPIAEATEVITNVLKNPQTFNGQYPMISSIFGLFLSYSCIHCIQNNRNMVSGILLALLVGTSIIFKSPTAVVLIIGFSCWTVIELIKKKKLSVMIPLAISFLIVSLTQLQLPSKSGDTITACVSARSLTWMFLPPNNFLGGLKNFTNVIGTFLLILFPGLLVILYRSKNSLIKMGPSHIYLLAFIIPSLVFLKLFSLGSDNIYQILDYLPMFAAMFTVILLLKNWSQFSIFWHRILIILMLVLILPPFGHRVVQTSILLLNPSLGHEFVDNRALAGALEIIPVSDSLIVTNDFRYPAENFKRDLRQLQFPALFGHQMYASNFKYERFYDSDRRLALQYRFREKFWDDELEFIASNEGWTHLIIHRASPHSENIPIPLIYQNEKYKVYEFKAPKTSLSKY